MTKLSKLIAGLLLSATCWASTVTVYWSYDYSQTNSAPCTGGGTLNCTTGFRVYYIGKRGYPITIAYYTNTGSEVGATDNINASAYVGEIGSMTFGVVATGYNGSHTYTESVPLTVPATLIEWQPVKVLIQ